LRNGERSERVFLPKFNKTVIQFLYSKGIIVVRMAVNGEKYREDIDKKEKSW